MAPDEAPHAEPHTLERAVSLYRLEGVLRTARRKPATRRQARRDKALVHADQGDQQPRERRQRPSGNGARPRKESGDARRGGRRGSDRGSRVRPRVHRDPTQLRRSSRRAAKLAEYASLRARTSRSHGPWCCCTSRRQISPSLRRKRLRATAVDWNLGTISPIRGWPAVLSIQMHSRNRDLQRRPPSSTRVRSARDARRLDGGRRSPAVSDPRASSRG
jgi:hypothetical protein